MKPQKMNACISPGTSRCEQLPLAEHEHGLVADARADVVGALDRLAHPDEPPEEERAAREEAARDGEQRRERERARARVLCRLAPF